MSNTSTTSTTLFVLWIDALSPKMLAYLASTWQLDVLAYGQTEKHGLFYVHFGCSGDPPEGFIESLDGQMNVLDYVIEGKG